MKTQILIPFLLFIYAIFIITAYVLGRSVGYSDGLDFCIESLQEAKVNYPQPDSTFVPHKFLTGEMARLNNEIEQLKDSLRHNRITWPWYLCNPIPKGEIIGAFEASGTGCNSHAGWKREFNIIWNGEKAVIQEQHTFFERLPEPKPKRRS